MRYLAWSAAVRVGVVLGVVGMLAPSLASAEIYAWIDSNGDVTYGNLPPPKNARVFEVIDETPPPSPQALAAAEAAHQAEMRALNDKVQQLEQEIRQSRYAPPPYPVGAPPPPASYGAPPDYAAGASYGGCDADYFDCDSWAGPIYYSVGVAPYWGFRRQRDFDGFRHGHGHFGRPGGGQRFASAPHFSGGSFHASSHGSGSGRSR